MKLTKMQLREIIREEISKLHQPKMSMRLKELISKGWVLSEDNDTVTNPKTGRKIKVTTALSYPSDHPAHKAAKSAQGGTSSTKSSSASSISINDKAWSMKKSKDRYGDPVFRMNDKAVGEMESMLNNAIGQSGTAEMNLHTGAIQYSSPDNDDVTINIGSDENGEYAVTMEDFEDTDSASDTYKTFKTPKEAMQYAAKLASRLK